MLVILGVFVFHCGRFFDTDGWHVKNAVRHPNVQVWTVFLVCWMMPLIFVISGASTFYALGSRGAGRFVKDRALRLGVPLIAGMFTHIAWQVYLERISFSGFRGSFFDFYPQYFRGLYGFGGNFAWMGLHLWYLEGLFLYSLLFLPLFLRLQSQSGSGALRAFGRVFGKPGAVYLLALPGMALMAWLNPQSQWGQRGFGGWPWPVYMFYFVYGFLVVTREEVEQQIEKQRWVSLGAAFGIFLALLVLWETGGEPRYGTARYALLLGLFALSSWCFVLAFLGLGRRYLGFTNSFVRYSNEAVLPFYVLHQTVILTVGYFVVRWAIPDAAKFLVIAVTAFTFIVLFYELGIRRNNFMRFLFGMRQRRTGAAAGMVALAAALALGLPGGCAVSGQSQTGSPAGRPAGGTAPRLTAAQREALQRALAQRENEGEAREAPTTAAGRQGEVCQAPSGQVCKDVFTSAELTNLVDQSMGAGYRFLMTNILLNCAEHNREDYDGKTLMIFENEGSGRICVLSALSSPDENSFALNAIGCGIASQHKKEENQIAIAEKAIHDDTLRMMESSQGYRFLPPCDYVLFLNSPRKKARYAKQSTALGQ